MKHLSLVRHGKASQFSPGLSDHSRPLIEVGVARIQRLRLQMPAFDYVLSSSATRTMQTAEILARDIPLESSDLLYHADPEDIWDEIERLADEVEHLVVVGHSPGIPALAHMLSGPSSEPKAKAELAQNYPTGGWSFFTAGPDRASFALVRTGFYL